MTETHIGSLCRGIVRLVTDGSLVTNEEAYEFARFLGHLLGLDSPQESRYTRLGLLMRGLDLFGRRLTPNEYRQLRAEADDGDKFSAVTSLVRAYGSFEGAVQAAIDLMRDRSNSRTSHRTYRERPRSAPYTRKEILDTLRRYHRTYGEWPYRTQFSDWGLQCRFLAARGGHLDPRIPDDRVIKAMFGSFDAAVEEAKRAPRGDQA
jgi:hypothetical protein